MYGGNTEEAYLEIFYFKQSYKHFEFVGDEERNRNKYENILWMETEELRNQWGIEDEISKLIITLYRQLFEMVAVT